MEKLLTVAGGESQKSYFYVVVLLEKFQKTE